MIGIVSAMESEVNKLLEYVENKEVKKILNIEFITGTLFSKDIVMCISLEGKVNSSIATTLMINEFNIDNIINLGVAGSVDEKVDIFDIVISSSTTQHDYDLTMLGYDKGYVLGVDNIYNECDSNLVVKFNDICKSININSHIGNVATGDIFVASDYMKETINSNFNSLAVDMEAAAINHICSLNNISFISIKVISDSGNKMEFRKFLEEAVNKLTNVVLEYFKKEV